MPVPALPADPAPPEVPPPPPRLRALTTAGALAVAAAAWTGALVARPLTLLVPLALAATVALVRRPVLLALPVALAGSALGARALDGLAPPPSGPVAGTATLVTDPEARWGSVEVVARLEGRHVLLRAEGAAGDLVAARLAGQRLVVEGRLRPLPEGHSWLRVRHVVAEVRLRSARPGPEAMVPWRAANHLRRLLVAGTEPLGEEHRALYLGLVLGDDRGQSPETVDDFRGSGLAHLLAVSGQNVAFVLGLATPVLRLLRTGPRSVAAIVLLGLFAVTTRYEPSVLRAVAMAGGATVAAARGRPTEGLHLLGLAVAGLVLVDPLLVRSLGFQLSVAATAGILVLGPRLADALRGPAPLVAAVSVSAAAQLGVAPLLLAGFGGIPVASLPANVLAGPAAATVMTWGLPAGLAAGVLGPPWDRWLHRPTGLALSALGGLARLAASAPLGELGPIHLVVVAAALGLLVGPGRRVLGGGTGGSASSGVPAGPGTGALGSDRGRSSDDEPTSPRRRSLRWTRALATVALVAAVLSPAVGLRRSPPVAEPVPGVTVWRAGGATVVVVEPGTGPVAVLEGLRRAGVTGIDLLVVGPWVAAGDAQGAARHRAHVGRVWNLGRDPPASTPPARVGPVEVVRLGPSSVCVRLPADLPCPP